LLNSVCFCLAGLKRNLIRACNDLGFRLGWAEPVAPPRSFTQSVGKLSVSCLAQAALGALDSLLKRELLGIVEFLLAGFSLAQELE